MKTNNLFFILILVVSIGAVLTTTSALADPIGLFPSVLSANTTGQSDSKCVGKPDDDYIHNMPDGSYVIYDFGSYTVNNGTGQDFNVYEFDQNYIEFNKIDVLVSSDGINFYSVKSSEGNWVNIEGDETHSNSSFAKSYDLPSGLSSARYIKILSIGAPPWSFDLDAIGAINYSSTPEPATLFLFTTGLAGIFSLRKRLRRT